MPNPLISISLCVALIAGAPSLAGATAPAKKSTQPAATKPKTYADHEAARLFAAELAERRGWPVKWTHQAIGKAQHLPLVTKLIMPPPVGTPKNWKAYRERFVEPKRLLAGEAFWHQHRRSLERAEKETGVPAWLVVGIIGVETYYGRHMGGFRVLDALATLSFDFPTGRSDRSAFFRSELESLLIWARREGRKPESVKGSYAGAVGWPQFMPSSILRHAVDFDRDGHINLERSVPDAIGSVAHFLKAHGWQPGLPTHFSVEPPSDEEARAVLLKPDILPSFTPTEMADKGAQLPEPARAHSGPLALVELHNGQGEPSFVAGTQNFYAITRYNWSSYYAMAVIELGRGVEQRLEQRRAAGPAKRGASPAAASPASGALKGSNISALPSIEATPAADRANGAAASPASTEAPDQKPSAMPRTTD